MSKLDYIKTKRQDVQEIPKKWVPLTRKIIKTYTRFNVWVYKMSKGRLLKNFPGGYPICLIGMTGAKSGKRREIALIHLPYKDNVLLIASQGGMDEHPLWYYNIKANPEIDIMVAGKTRQMQARQLDDDEKRLLWPHILTLYPDFDEYQARTDRNIPVFLCEPTN